MNISEIVFYIVFACVAISGILIEMHTVMQIGSGAVVAAFCGIMANGITRGNTLITILTFGISWVIAWAVLFIIFFKKRSIFHDKEDGFLAFNGMLVRVNKGNDNSHGYGEIRINDKVFRFKSQDKIKANDIVKIKEIKGVTMFVEKENK